MQCRTLSVFAAGILLLFLASPGRAQSYPVRPVTIVVPFTTGSGIQYVRGGKIRILAVMGSERSPVFPSAPTLEQAGYPNVQTSSWYALLAPAGTPVAIIARLNADLNALLADAAIRDFLAKQGFSPAGGTPEALTNQFRTELERWLRIADEAKITVD